jgi:hypothetical protein
MLPWVALPALVRHDAPWLASVCSPEACAPFQRYIRGVSVSDHQTVEGIHRIVVRDVRNPRSLKRWFTERPCAGEAFHQARRQRLSSLAGTEMQLKGVLSLEETVLTHDGTHVDPSAYGDDHPPGWSGWAHPLVTLPDRDAPTDSPVDFRFWEPGAVDELAAGRTGAGVPLRERQ